MRNQIGMVNKNAKVKTLNFEIGSQTAEIMERMQSPDKHRSVLSMSQIRKIQLP